MMNLLKKLSLYWRLVEIDLKSSKSVRHRIGKPPGHFIASSKKEELTKVANDIKFKQADFKDVQDSKYNINL
jgi:hypothetical protein